MCQNRRSQVGTRRAVSEGRHAQLFDLQRLDGGHGTPCPYLAAPIIRSMRILKHLHHVLHSLAGKADVCSEVVGDNNGLRNVVTDVVLAHKLLDARFFKRQVDIVAHARQYDMDALAL